MCDKNTTSGNPIALLQNVATANSQQERQSALKAVNQYLMCHSLEEACSLAQKLPHILAQYQMDALDAYILSADCPQELRVARDDLRQLLTPVFPALLVSGEALKLREKVDELESLSDYLESRVELREAILDLPPAEGEAVSGQLHHRLETLLLEEAVPCVPSTGNPPAGLAAQFSLWQDVSACEDLGMEHLALYFLAPAREGIRVWMPCCFTSLRRGLGHRPAFPPAEQKGASGTVLPDPSMDGAHRADPCPRGVPDPRYGYAAGALSAAAGRLCAGRLLLLERPHFPGTGGIWSKTSASC